MCLIIDRYSQPQIATEDIVVYKHLIQDTDNEFITSYKHAPVTIGETYSSKIGVTISDSGTRVVEMALHSFGDKADAQRGAESYDEVLVECIIPKGSTYYIGRFEYYPGPSYASNRLKYVKVLSR